MEARGAEVDAQDAQLAEAPRRCSSSVSVFTVSNSQVSYNFGKSSAGFLMSFSAVIGGISRGNSSMACRSPLEVWMVTSRTQRSSVCSSQRVSVLTVACELLMSNPLVHEPAIEAVIFHRVEIRLP